MSSSSSGSPASGSAGAATSYVLDLCKYGGPGNGLWQPARGGVARRSYQLNCGICTPSEKLAYKFMLNYVALESHVWEAPSKWTQRYTHAEVLKQLKQHDTEALVLSLGRFYQKGRSGRENLTAKAFFQTLGGEYQVGVALARRIVRDLLSSTSTAVAAVTQATSALEEARALVKVCEQRLALAEGALRATRKRAAASAPSGSAKRRAGGRGGRRGVNI